MSPAQRIYLDNAATSFPKPEAVYAAMDAYHRENGCAAARGTSALGMSLQASVSRCRSLAAKLLGAESADRIVFTLNCTDSLNMALHGLLRPGDHVVATKLEHNSVLRPLHALKSRIGIDFTLVDMESDGRVAPMSIQNELRPETRLVALTHASNVTGTVQPIEDIGEIAQKHGAKCLVDAAQTAGHIPIALNDLPVDLLACAGHKGLMGPLGTGLLYVRPGLEENLVSLRQGGTGTVSERPTQPDSMPEKFEAGNLNAPGVVGLEAALEWIDTQGIDSLQNTVDARLLELKTGLRELPAVTLFTPPNAVSQTGVLSIRVDGFEPHDFATVLDDAFGIQTRAGLHCAPGAHSALGTSDGGTVRFSVGPLTTKDDIGAAIEAVSSVIG